MASQACDFCDDALYSDYIGFYMEGEPKNWDGFCKAGSRHYFADLSARNIVDNVILTRAVLEDMGKTEDYSDPIVMHKTDWLEDEVQRAMRELLFRLEDGVHSTQKPEV